MTGETMQYRPVGVPEMFMQTVNAAIDLKGKALEGRDTEDVQYREAFYTFYKNFMCLYYVTRWDVLNGKTLDGLETTEKRQELVNSIEQFDEDVMTGKLEKADATTGVKLFRQYIEYLKYFGLIRNTV